MSKTPLRALGDEDVPAPPSSLVDAADRSERTLLVAMRTRVLKEIDTGVPAAYLAPLMRQVREMDKELRALDLRAKEDGADASDVIEDEELDAASF